MRTALLLMLVAVSAADAAENEFDCMIEPLQIIEVRSPVVGLIHSIHVRRGDVVKTGQLLATVDSSVQRSAADAARAKSEAQGALRLAEAKLDEAKIKAERNESLFADGFVSAQDRDEAVAERAKSAAEVQAAKENLRVAKLEHQEALDEVRRRELRSPISGVVMDQYLYRGSLVDNSEGKKPIMKLAQTDTLKVETIVPFGFYQKLKVGTPAQIVPEAPLSGEYKGVIKIIDRVIDSASGTFGVLVELDNPSYDIPAGVRCKVRFVSR